MSYSGTSYTKELQCDLAVIGGGGGGLAAAVAARENGVKNIVVLEAQPSPGGNARFPWCMFAAESPAQKRLGIDAPRDELLRKALDYAHWKSDPKLLRALIEKSGDTIRWLEEKGLEFFLFPPTLPYGNAVQHFVTGPKVVGAAVVEALTSELKDLGVQLLYQTRARSLLTSKEGKGIGVLAEGENGEIRITAKGVIISTGGYPGNEELIKKYLPSYNKDEVYLVGLPHEGDGLRMATEVEAATEGMGVLEAEGPLFPWSSSLYPIIRRGYAVWVNKMGERFADEIMNMKGFLFQGSNALWRQPGKISYSLFDEKIKQRLLEEGLSPRDEYRMNLGGREYMQKMSSESWRASVDNDLQSQVGRGRVMVSDSWDEIARWIGAVPEVLKHTIDEYNSFCDQGYDKVFVKDPRYLLPLRTPPYYALQCCIVLVTTHGGVKVNHRMEVLDCQGMRINGLYAAGDVIGGTEGDTYDGINLVGHSFAFAISSGRIAGENAARCVLGLC